MRQAKIYALLEVSDHDGYCTDNECDYSTSHSTYYVDIPNGFENHPTGLLNDDDIYLYNWIGLLPKPHINDCGSYYCDESEQAMDANLDRHDYRYTIFTIEIVDVIEITS